MSLTDVENNDLQKYLDSFNKEIDEGSQTTDGDGKFIVDKAASSGADVEDADGNDEDDGTYFVDQSGNYYYQATKKSMPIASKPPEDIGVTANDTLYRDKTPIAAKTTSVKIEEFSKAGEDDDDEDDDDMEDYVLILDGEGKEVYPEELNPDDPDEENEIYDFDEKDETKESVVPSNIIRLKANSTDANETIHDCIHCNYVTNKRYLLSRHMRMHSDDRPHKCSVCERGFKSNLSLVNHVNTHLGIKPHPCTHCDKAFVTSGELVRHLRYKHTFEKPHKCSECDYASVELSKLKRHMRCHTGERPYQCPHCTYASPDTFKLKRHMRTHTGEKPYQCDICNARFTQSNSMKAHRLIHSVGKKPAFQCSLCPTTCGRKTDLRIHIQKLHHSEEPIMCKRCGKSSPDRYSYKLHVKTHEGEKCFRCSICPYASISWRHLESHMLIHTDEKPFICEICELSFRQKQLLKRHINLYHTSNYVPPKPRAKRHTCPHCKRSYSSKGNLMRHMEIHDPESNLKQEKLKLKIGRKYRVPSVDGGGVGEQVNEEGHNQEQHSVGEDDSEEDDDYCEESEVGYEVIETIEEEEELEQKPAVQQTLLNMAKKHDTLEKQEQMLPDIKTVSIKKEPGGKEFMAVEGADGEQYMVVEVIQSDYDEDDDDLMETEQFEEQTELNTADPDKHADVKNCFGFDDEDCEEFLDDTGSKETIQLLEIIDDDD